jgi:DNA-binding transcriptional ArsR family regulator
MTDADLDRIFAALADPTRRKVVSLLRRRPLRAGELAAAFDMSAPAMSRHLRVLRQTGLVEEEGLTDDARVRIYSLRPERFAVLRDWLSEIEGYWADQLGALKAHVERAAPGSKGKASTKKGSRRKGAS